MRFLRFISGLCLITILITTLPIQSSACSCVQPGSVQEELERTDVVFSGEVIDIFDENEKKEIISSADVVQYVFEVKEIWKGTEQSQVLVSSARDSASCGFEFELNMKYLVFAQLEEDATISTGLCTMTESLESSASQLESLGEGAPPSEAVKIDFSKEVKQEQTKEHKLSNYLFIPIIVSLVFIVYLFLNKQKHSS